MASDSPDGDKRGLVIGLSVALMSLTIVTMALRLFTRFFILRSIGNDDMFFIFAAILAVMLSVLNIISTKYGLARSIELQRAEDVRSFQQVQLASSGCYSGCVMFVKLSLLCLYLRLSPSRSFRIGVYVMMGVSVAFGIASIFVVALQCIPISKLWKPDQPGTCIQVVDFYYANAAINIALDLIIYCMPIKVIWALQLPTRQRLGLVLLFALGSIVLVASIIRLTTLHDILNTTDQTWDLVMPLNWSTIEVHIAVFVTCGPAFKAFVRRYLPRLLGGSSYRNSSGHRLGHTTGTRVPPYGSYQLSSTNHHRNEQGTKTIITAVTKAKSPESESEENIVLPYQGILAETSVKVDHHHPQDDSTKDSDAASSDNIVGSAK